MNTLGEEFDGILGCDYFSAYRRYMKKCDIRVQFCLAHLIRDVKFLTTLPDPRDRSYGEALRAALKKLFEVFHHREQHSKAEFQPPAERGARHGSTVGPVRPADAARPEHGEAVSASTETPISRSSPRRG